MRRLFPSIIALLMVAGTLSAQTTDNKSTETTKKNREPVGVNLSLWKNMSTQQTDTVGSTCFNLGLFSSMNRLNGVGINLLGSVVYRDMNGVFFFNDTATTEIYTIPHTLSLHDALPI